MAYLGDRWVSILPLYRQTQSDMPKIIQPLVSRVRIKTQDFQISRVYRSRPRSFHQLGPHHSEGEKGAKWHHMDSGDRIWHSKLPPEVSI